MKLDVEGADLDALETMMGLLHQLKVRAVIMEFNLNQWYEELSPARRALAGADIMETLTKLGFGFFELLDDKSKSSDDADWPQAWPALELREVTVYEFQNWTEDIAHCRKHVNKLGFCLPDILMLQDMLEKLRPTDLGRALATPRATTSGTSGDRKGSSILLRAGPRVASVGSDGFRPSVPKVKVHCISKALDAENLALLTEVHSLSRCQGNVLQKVSTPLT